MKISLQCQYELEVGMSFVCVCVFCAVRFKQRNAVDFFNSENEAEGLEQRKGMTKNYLVIVLL